MAELEEIRAKINRMDEEIKKSLLLRMELSAQVAERKRDSGERTVYRPEREREILRERGRGVDEDERYAYLSVVRGVMAASRMLQYDRMEGWYPGVVDGLLRGLSVPEAPSGARVRFRLEDPDMLAVFLTAAADRGIGVSQVRSEDGMSRITLSGSVREPGMRRLLYQMASEARDFAVEDVF